MKKGFSLIELLVVIAIVAVVSSILFMVLNPVEYLKRARDSQRLRDYTLIRQAVNYYLYSTAVDNKNADMDGPSYSDSCAGQSASKIFVSVPDNAEQSPTPPPAGWTYNRVQAANLSSAAGAGWLPIDFSSLSGSAPIRVLPVDPVNTFASGYYYTYTCGSFELNLRFETDKYRALAQLDGGDDDAVYETGVTLTEAPFQNSYHPSTVDNAGTTVLLPSATGVFANGWTGNWGELDDAVGSPNDSDRIYASTTNAAATFGLTDPDPRGSITSVRLVVRANKVGLNTFHLLPRLRVNGQVRDSAAINLTTTYTNYSATYELNPVTGQPWTWSEINELEAGVYLSYASGSGTAQVSQIYVEVEHQ